MSNDAETAEAVQPDVSAVRGGGESRESLLGTFPPIESPSSRPGRDFGMSRFEESIDYEQIDLVRNPENPCVC